MLHDIRYQPLEFDGFAERHFSLPFDGERFSVVWFSSARLETAGGADDAGGAGGSGAGDGGGGRAGSVDDERGAERSIGGGE